MKFWPSHLTKWIRKTVNGSWGSPLRYKHFFLNESWLRWSLPRWIGDWRAMCHPTPRPATAVHFSNESSTCQRIQWLNIIEHLRFFDMYLIQTIVTFGQMVGFMLHVWIFCARPNFWFKRVLVRDNKPMWNKIIILHWWNHVSETSIDHFRAVISPSHRCCAVFLPMPVIVRPAVVENLKDRRAELWGLGQLGGKASKGAGLSCFRKHGMGIKHS